MTPKLAFVFLLAAGFLNAAPEVADINATVNWSFTSDTVNPQAQLVFDLSSIPIGSIIDSASLTLGTVSLTANFAGSPNAGCANPLTLTFYGLAYSCTDSSGAEFLDEATVDGSIPGAEVFALASDAQNQSNPIDPSFITPGGTYSVLLTPGASGAFIGWDDPFAGGAPPVLDFSATGEAQGQLEVDFSDPAPEPGFLALIAAASVCIAARYRGRTNPAQPR